MKYWGWVRGNRKSSIVVFWRVRLGGLFWVLGVKGSFGISGIME